MGLTVKDSLIHFFFAKTEQHHNVHTVYTVYTQCHAPLNEHPRALRHKLKSCTVPFLYRSDLVKSRRMLYRSDVCNCTMPYVPRTVPAYAVRDPAYTAEVFALTLVQIDVMCGCVRTYHFNTNRQEPDVWLCQDKSLQHKHTRT